MRAAKTYFEQIPVETVKKIATELPPSNGVGNDGVSDAQDEIASPPKRWREVAQQVQQEQDPAKMVELVEQLIAKFDEEELRKHPRSFGTEGC